MTTIFERRQRLISALNENPGIRVPELAEHLDVSEGTIRNDLRALAELGQLTRVRGGGVPNNSQQGRSPAFEARVMANQVNKQCIARLAASLVEDGDSILLDASSTVYHLATFLQERRSLTVITNGLEAGRVLAKNPTNTVILLGGVLRTDGTSITGPLGEMLLRDLHVKSAFVSCSGFTTEIGLTEVDIHEAQLKRKMIANANRVIALIDSSKFGRVDLSPFARIHQVACILTDCDLSSDWIEKLRHVGIEYTLCGPCNTHEFSLSDL